MSAQGGRQPSTSIFIGNVGFSANEEDLSTLFKQVGPLKSFRLVTDRDTGKPKGYAFAEYFDIPTAQSAQRNLNGADLNGRSLRVDFADSEKHSSDHKGPPKPIIVGKEAAATAGQTMAAALGGNGGSGQQQISDALSKMTRPQIFEIMNQMKALIQQNPGQARQILVQNPQLTKALFQAQILLGMVSPPPAANGVTAPAQASQPLPAQQQQQPPPAQIPAPVQLPPPSQAQQPQFAPQQQPGAVIFQQQPAFQLPGQAGGIPQPQPLQQASFPQQQAMPRPQTLPVQMPGPRPYSGPPGPALPAPRTLPAPGALPTPPVFAGQHQMPQVPADPRRVPQQPQPGQYDPRQQPPIDPRQQAQPQAPGAPLGPRQPIQDPRLQPPRDARPQQGAVDPRQQVPHDPRQMHQAGPAGQQGGGLGGFPPQQQAAPLDPRQQPPNQQLPSQQQQPVLGHAEQQALLRQVMSLTPQQIEMLPDAQKQQVLDLQRQLRGQVMPA